MIIFNYNIIYTFKSIYLFYPELYNISIYFVPVWEKWSLDLYICAFMGEAVFKFLDLRLYLNTDSKSKYNTIKNRLDKTSVPLNWT